MIKAKLKNALVADISVRAHQLISGLSEKLGGHDEGPNPHEILEASLAACTILTAQLYAARKGMKLESTDVVVQIVSEGEETQISREVSFRGELSVDERARLREIIEKCPIHKLLQSHVSIATTVASLG